MLVGKTYIISSKGGAYTKALVRKIKVLELTNTTIVVLMETIDAFGARGEAKSYRFVMKDFLEAWKPIEEQLEDETWITLDKHG